jgi:hypothetical protein
VLVEGLEGDREGMSEPQPPGDGFGATLDEAIHKAVSRMRRSTDEMGAALASTSITAGENLHLDPHMANAVLDRAQDLLNKLTNVKADADSLKMLTPAAADMVSTSYNKKLTTTGDFVEGVNPFSGGGAFDAGAEQLNATIAYLTAYVTKLNEALGKTQATEQHNGEIVTKAGQSHEQKPGGLAG